MGEEAGKQSGPDLGLGIPEADLAEGGLLVGHVGDEPVLLARRGAEVFAIGAVCSHYGGPLGEGLLVDETIRCPWHHACFSLRTGEVLRAPALNPVACWRIDRRDGAIYVSDKLEIAPRPATPAAAGARRAVVIVGGGAAADAAADALRREGYSGALTMFSADDSAPYDRPNLSKGFLAGSAPEDWLPLRSRRHYEKRGIDLRLGARVVAIDAKAQIARLADGAQHSYDGLLLATGAEPVRLTIPGADLPHVRMLRSLADCRELVARAQSARRAVVIGASFIGLEAAAALRARKVEVEVVGPDAIPMERILGPEVGRFIRKLHEEEGVVFHLGTTATAIDGRFVELKNGEKLEADLVLVGVGVRPAVGLAEAAGLAVDRGVLVDEYLATSAPNIFAAGDIARWPDAFTGERIRIEHFIVAERQGRTAARNILGHRERFDAVPFFWTEQYDLTISYVGHAEGWDNVEIDGSIEARDCALSYRRAGKTLAVATINRDIESLRAELEFEGAKASR
ncbi:FAD-dependent oxidoreductase [Methylocapsa acidiphila]|uniref:FAD-dependent oxidoreductase n=1 Tax=Methylocapsa acidiphila TaxID=133552 RepID=UPI0004106277|nr:FAD-dependent oxidoreductase [Methylocapsa acidiphila]